MTDSEVISRSTAGWAGSVRDFMRLTQTAWLDSLIQHQKAIMAMAPEDAQIQAWRSSEIMLKRALREVLSLRPSAGNWSIIFEYVLPRERGRRPDVVILADDTILVLEFKDFSRPSISHRDQVAAYARDLSHYHGASHGRPIYPLLVMTKRGDAALRQSDGVSIVGEMALIEYLAQLPTRKTEPIDPAEWIEADYEPLPSLVAAARRLFENEPLPSIRRALSSGIPQTLATLEAIRNQAQRTHSRHLALITGVPGAGKTLVGLQFVYQVRAHETEVDRLAVFLSGNGPLVSVLRHALKTGVFVQDVHAFLLTYGGNTKKLPREHVWIYDEAQRAWDMERVRTRRADGHSEPEDFLKIGARMPSWALMIGLIGEGQEIHLGEESGLEQWNDAISASGVPWVVHCPTRIANVFSNAHSIVESPSLDLTTSLRSHLAEDVQRWITTLLRGQIEESAAIAKRINADGFDAYITRDIETAKLYVRTRYAEEPDKRYGLLASSKAKNLEQFGVDNSWDTTRRLKDGPWYNDPSESPLSCCQLDKVVTEFSCQGLELDFPIVCWGDDIFWNGEQWMLTVRPRARASSAKDPLQLRINSYRVLLSRGRDGFVVYVPPTSNMDTVADVLTMAGLQSLRSAQVLAE
jgi:DUF2075 family protein